MNIKVTSPLSQHEHLSKGEKAVTLDYVYHGGLSVLASTSFTQVRNKWANYNHAVEFTLRLVI